MGGRRIEGGRFAGYGGRLSKQMHNFVKDYTYNLEIIDKENDYNVIHMSLHTISRQDYCI